MSSFIGAATAQDLGPQVKKLADGVYVHTGRGFESNSGIILTQEGVIVIDTGQNPYESRNIWATVRNLTSMPVRFVIDTEPHADHTTGNFMFSPPAVVVAAAGAGDSMRAAEKQRAGSHPAARRDVAGVQGGPRRLPVRRRRTSSTRTG